MQRIGRRGASLWLVLALVWLAACTPVATPSATPPPGDTSAPSDTPMPEVGAVLPTRIPPTEGPSPTPLPTITLTPSETPVESDTPTPTETSTATPTLTATDTPTQTPVPPTDTLAPGMAGLHVALTWATTGNVDLGVRDAAGEMISGLRPTSASGGELSGDANALCATATTDPVEAVVWPDAQTAPAGRYTVTARYQATCGNSGPVEVTVVASLNGVELLRQSASLTLGQEFTFQFDYNPASGITPASGSGTPSAASPTPGTVEANRLAYGDTASGTISDEQYEWTYTFEGARGDVVTISLSRTGGDLDPYLILRNAGGTQIAFNDDAADQAAPFNARIQGFTLPAAGTYTIVATRYRGRDGASGGDFELVLQQGSVEPTAAPPTPTPASTTTAVPTASALAIAYGSTVTGTISDENFEERFAFDGMRGDLVTITMRHTDGDLDPYLILLNAAGARVAFNDDAADGTATLDSRIHNFALPATGTYTIVATRFLEDAGQTTGDFELELERNTRTATPALTPAAEVLALAYGVTVTGAISDEQPAVRYTFDGAHDDLVTISMHRRGGDLDSYLILLNPSGAQVAVNDDAPDAGETRDARISRFRLPAAGMYTLVATRFEGPGGSTSGDFELTLERAN